MLRRLMAEPEERTGPQSLLLAWERSDPSVGLLIDEAYERSDPFTGPPVSEVSERFDASTGPPVT